MDFKSQFPSPRYAKLRYPYIVFIWEYSFLKAGNKGSSCSYEPDKFLFEERRWNFACWWCVPFSYILVFTRKYLFITLPLNIIDQVSHWPAMLGLAYFIFSISCCFYKKRMNLRVLNLLKIVGQKTWNSYARPSIQKKRVSALQKRTFSSLGNLSTKLTWTCKCWELEWFDYDKALYFIKYSILIEFIWILNAEYSVLEIPLHTFLHKRA